MHSCRQSRFFGSCRSAALCVVAKQRTRQEFSSRVLISPASALPLQSCCCFTAAAVGKNSFSRGLWHNSSQHSTLRDCAHHTHTTNTINIHIRRIPKGTPKRNETVRNIFTMMNLFKKETPKEAAMKAKRETKREVRVRYLVKNDKSLERRACTRNGNAAFLLSPTGDTHRIP